MRDLLGILFWMVAFPAIAFTAKKLGERRDLKARQSIQDWSEFNDCQLIDIKPSYWYEQFTLGLSTTQVAYRVTLMLASGETGRCLMIYGGVYNVLSKDLEVRWEVSPRFEDKDS